MAPSFKVIAAIFIGGGLGSVLRYAIGFLGRNWWQPFPMGTLLSNLLASILLVSGILFFEKHTSSDAAKAFLLIGFCGGFSTFSTFSWETFQLWKEGHIVLAILNVALSIGACLLAISIIYRNWGNEL